MEDPSSGWPDRYRPEELEEMALAPDLRAVAALREAITTLNSRARKLEALSAEAAALAHRFALTAPSLSILPEPRQDVASSLPALWRHHVFAQAWKVASTT